MRHLWQPTEFQMSPRIYAVLDAARHAQIYPRLCGSESEYCCLYRGELASELAEVAPYLVALEQDNAFTSWLISQGWGDNWGIFLESSASLHELRRHFRRFLMVYDAQGKSLYFRYYDPRVWRVYLPTCTAAELQIVFGPVSRYCIEAKERDTLLEYAWADGQLTQRSALLATARRPLYNGHGERSQTA
jgi:hypothetical protein